MALGRPPDDGVDPRNTLPCQTDLQLIANLSSICQRDTEPTLTRCAFIIQPLGLSSATTLSLPLRPVLKRIARTCITRDAGGYFGCQPLALSGRPDSPGGSRPSRTITVADEGQRRAIPALAPLRHLLVRDTGWVYCPLCRPACASAADDGAYRTDRLARPR